MAKKVKEIRFTFRELRMRHFRAFENARLPLDGMTVLLGRNGAGKTSIMLGLEFLREAVVDSLPNAIARRGGLKAIRQHQAAGAPYDVSMALVLDSGPISVVYGFVLGARRGGSGFEVKEEVLESSAGPGFHRKQNKFDTRVSDLHPSLDKEALALPMIAGAVPLWKQVLRTVRKIRLYSLSPATIGAEPEIGSTTWLKRDGGNASDVLKSLESRKAVKSWIVGHLAALTPFRKTFDLRKPWVVFCAPTLFGRPRIRALSATIFSRPSLNGRGMAKRANSYGKLLKELERLAERIRSNA